MIEKRGARGSADLYAEPAGAEKALSGPGSGGNMLRAAREIGGVVASAPRSGWLARRLAVT